MDPIAHSLAGATLAQTGLKKFTPLATACLIISANLPDIDGIANFLGRDTALNYRRGITHGILAMILLPALLTGIFMVFDRWIRLKRHRQKKPIRPLAILTLSYLGVLSHPFLDWLNTYGVRLLMPFDGRWFYGDTLFIIDPWMWLLMSIAVVYIYSKKRFCKISWLLLGLFASLLISLASMVPLLAKLAWWLGFGIIICWRLTNNSRARNKQMARLSLAIFSSYLFAMSLINLKAKKVAENWLKQKSPSQSIINLMTGPLPANPFDRELIFASKEYYYGLKVSILSPDQIVTLFEPVQIKAPNAIIEKALAQEDIQGFVNWMRFPVYEVLEKKEGQFEVLIRDLRYVRPGQTEDIGIGFTKTFVSMDTDNNKAKR